MKANSVRIADIFMALSALTASCAVSGSHLMSLTKPLALQMQHTPVSAFLGLNRLSKDIEEFAGTVIQKVSSGVLICVIPPGNPSLS